MQGAQLPLLSDGNEQGSAIAMGGFTKLRSTVSYIPTVTTPGQHQPSTTAYPPNPAASLHHIKYRWQQGSPSVPWAWVGCGTQWSTS